MLKLFSNMVIKPSRKILLFSTMSVSSYTNIPQKIAHELWLTQTLCKMAQLGLVPFSVK